MAVENYSHKPLVEFLHFIHSTPTALSTKGYGALQPIPADTPPWTSRYFITGLTFRDKPKLTFYYFCPCLLFEDLNSPSLHLNPPLCHFACQTYKPHLIQ